MSETPPESSATADQPEAVASPAGRESVAMRDDGAERAQPKRPSRAAFWLALLALLLAIAGPIGLWQWSLKNTRELARRVQSSGERVQQADSRLEQALAQVRDLKSRTEIAEGKLAEAAGQQAQLEKLYKSVALDSAEALLAELESALSLAAQQLASGGSAEAALLALQAADGRLARLADPGLIGVRRAIGRDIERLRGATSGDIGVIAARLDTLARDLDNWPLRSSVLASAAGAKEPTPPNDAAPQSGWRRWIRIDTMLDELAGLFRVRRVDAPDAALIAPDQSYFLRENLRLRLLSARLALLSRHDPLYRSDIDSARAWVERYFDTQAGEVSQAIAQLDQLRGARAADSLPSVTDSLGAVRAARAARESKE